MLKLKWIAPEKFFRLFYAHGNTIYIKMSSFGEPITLSQNISYKPNR